jgi:hypothetical protein
MNRTMWILLALLAAMSIAAIWRDSQGLPEPSWTLCKESLFTQFFTGACTLRFKGPTTQS